MQNNKAAMVLKSRQQRASWILSKELSRKLHLDVLSAVADDLDLSAHPLLRRLVGNLRSGSYARAVDISDSITEQCYGSAFEHFRWNQIAALVGKVPFEDPGLTPDVRARKTFLLAEHRCRRTNQLLRASRSVNRFPLGDLLARVKVHVRRCIGEKPDMPSVYSLCDFGPGASLGVHGNSTNVADKLTSVNWTVTPECAPYARSALAQNAQVWEYLMGIPFCLDKEAFDRLVDSRLKYVSANKITFVPKSAKTHRSIAIEPLLNTFVQKGIDRYMRLCLKRKGVDLSCQTKNQTLAKAGSTGGFNPLVTIDLSSASDSISTELVRELLPPDWFALLNETRSKSFVLDKEQRRFEKFVSMGNGFCFPLETLIFWAFGKAVNEVTGEKVISVYGDDIIVRQNSALLLIELLKRYGFRTNVSKTFIHGPFRESCGEDFYNGIRVRPIFLRKHFTHYRDLFVVLNGLRDLGLDTAWDKVLRLIPERFRYLRPHDGNSDTAITCERDLFMGSPHAKWLRHEQRWSWRELVTVPLGRPCNEVGVQMYSLLRGGSIADETGQPVFHFRRTARTHTRWV